MDLSRLALLCDFDGTIARDDVGQRLFARFAGEVSRQAVSRWLNDEIGSRECLELECAAVRATRAEILDYVGGSEIDPGFHRLVALSQEAGFPLLVVSDGLDFYIRHILGRHGLGELPVRANGAEFRDVRMVPLFPYTGEGCGQCANCKGYHARLHREEGRRVVFVGDGLSDRCGARESDLVLAKEGRDLARWCRREEVPHLLFGELGEVARLLETKTLDELRREAGAPA